MPDSFITMGEYFEQRNEHIKKDFSDGRAGGEKKDAVVLRLAHQYRISTRRIEQIVYKPKKTKSISCDLS